MAHRHLLDVEALEVRQPSGKPLAIDGPWGLIVGDPSSGGVDSVWFSAGPDEESHELLGTLRAS